MVATTRKEGNDVVAIRLREKRRMRGWTQEDLAERADLEQSQISAWERGSKRPSMENVAKLAVAFEQSHEELARELGYLDPPTEGDGKPRLTPALQQVMEQMCRDFPSLCADFEKNAADPDFPNQVRTLAQWLGYQIRGMLDERERGRG